MEILSFTLENMEVLYEPVSDMEYSKADEKSSEEPKKRYDEDNDIEDEEYHGNFIPKLQMIYMMGHESKMEHEYNSFGTQETPDEDENCVEMENSLTEHFKEDASYAVLAQSHNETMLLADVPVTYEAGVLDIYYEVPELINGQETYRRIVSEVTDEMTVYEFTKGMFGNRGIESTERYDSEFGSVMIDSVDGKRDGDDGNFWEFYVNGEIGADSVDKATVKKGDIVEWRRAEETDGSCGGVPDYAEIRAMLEYGATQSANATPYGMGVHLPGTPRSFYGSINLGLIA